MTAYDPSAVKLPIGVSQIQAMLPHRYPFLLVDRVIGFEAHKTLSAIKNVTFNEPFFQGHFPGHPVMPGVLIVEAMAQAAGLLTQLSEGPRDIQPIYYLVKVDNARFSKIVLPGDQLTLNVVLKRTMRKMGLYECCALVDGKEVASAEILCAEQQTSKTNGGV